MINYKSIPVKIVITLIILIQPLFWIKHFYSADRSALHIAVIGPDEKQDSYVNATRLYIRNLNQQGGIHSNELRLDVYDDHNDPVTAVKIASKIVEEGRAIAVIGHQSDTCTLAAGEIYKEAGIPIITPSAMGQETVEDNKWLFRTVFSLNLQSRFIAHYINNVFEPKAVMLVAGSDSSSQEMVIEFQKTLRTLDVPIKHRWEVQSEARTENAITMIKEIKKTNDTSLPLILLTHPYESVQIIQHLKDEQIPNPVITPVGFSQTNLTLWFQDLPKEKMHPGYYTDGLYAVSAFSYELANENAQRFKRSFSKRFEVDPKWDTAYAHDAAMIISEGIRQYELKGNRESIKSDRNKLREYISGLSNVKDSLLGMTGLNFFDEKGNSFKPIAMGIYKGTQLIPAPHQFQIIKDIKEIGTLEEDLDEGRIIKVGKEYFYKTSVVHSGIEIIELSSLDEENLTFKANFYLWFRYNQGDIDITALEFLNSLKPIKLKPPVAEEIIDQSVYRRYQVEGTFRADFIPSDVYRAHVLGVAFRHKNKTRRELQFIKDELGMLGKVWPEGKEAGPILNSLHGWNITDASYYHDISRKRTWGNIKYIDHIDKTIEHSRFTAKIQVSKIRFSPRLLIPEPLSGYLTLITLFLLSAFFWLKGELAGEIAFRMYPATPTKKKRKTGFSYWLEDNDDSRQQFIRITKKKRIEMERRLVRMGGFVRILLSFLLLILVETTLIQSLLGTVSETTLDSITKFFDVLWWVIPAKMLNDVIQKNIFDTIEYRSDRKVPGLIRGFTAFLIYLLTSFGIIAFVFDFKITGLIATSGILMMIIGLAIQLNIANIFSGIALNLERPYHVGDWVKVGSYSEGRVIDINWRTTRFEDKLGCIFAIPNSTVAESFIHNFSLPSEMYNDWISVYIDPEHDPEKVKAVLLKAVSEVDEHILKDPACWVYFFEITDTSAVYLVGWSSIEYRAKYDVRQLAWLSIWKHLDKAKIRPAVRRQAIQLQQNENRELPEPLQSKLPKIE